MREDKSLPEISTALNFLAYMVYHPTAHLNLLTDIYKQLPSEERARVKEAFIAVREDKAEA